MRLAWGRAACSHPSLSRGSYAHFGELLEELAPMWLSATAQEWFWITFSAGATEGHHKRDHERPWVMCFSGTCGSTKPKAS